MTCEGFLLQPGGCSPVKLLGFTCFPEVRHTLKCPFSGKQHSYHRAGSDDECMAKSPTLMSECPTNCPAAAAAAAEDDDCCCCCCDANDSCKTDPSCRFCLENTCDTKTSCSTARRVLLVSSTENDNVLILNQKK